VPKVKWKQLEWRHDSEVGYIYRQSRRRIIQLASVCAYEHDTQYQSLSEPLKLLLVHGRRIVMRNEM